MNDNKAKYLLIAIIIIAVLSVLSVKQIVLFKPGRPIVNKQNSTTQLEINPQSKPEDVVKTFLTYLNKGLVNQSELRKAWSLLTKSLQKSVTDAGLGSSNLLSNILKTLKLEDPAYNSVEIINNGFSEGVFNLDLKLIYPDNIVVRSIKLIIEDEIWKINEVRDVETLKVSDTLAVNSWKFSNNNLYEIKYPQNWILNKNTLEDTVIQNSNVTLDKLANYPVGASSVQIRIINIDPAKPLENVVNCQSIPNYSCKYVYLSDRLFKEIKTNTGSSTKLTYIYIGKATDKNVLLTVAGNVETKPELEDMLKSVIATFKIL